VLCKTIKTISPETREAVNKVLIHYAQNEKTEKGREIRIDCTVVESNIHEPTDSSLLFDSVKILSRLLSKAKEVYCLPIIFTDHTRRAKRRNLGILNAKGEKDRKKHYIDLLKVTGLCRQGC
jgi:IS5 family transposase